MHYFREKREYIENRQIILEKSGEYVIITVEIQLIFDGISNTQVKELDIYEVYD